MLHMTEYSIAAEMRSGRSFNTKEKLAVVARLSMPGILAQISEILMQYIDAAMVGALGAAASASIGLVASSTWLFGGILGATAAGFSVQVAHATGAGEIDRAKSIFRQSLSASFLLSFVVGAAAFLTAQHLPQWLGADPSLWANATKYLSIYALFVPVRQIRWLCMNMLQCSGNMKIPSIFATLECFLDVVFNYFLIFPVREVVLFGSTVMMPGAGLGVAGAQLGTSLAMLSGAVMSILYAFFCSDVLKLKGMKGSWIPEKETLKEAFHIGAPMAMEQSALCAAQVVSTKIIAPLGTIAIAANSFAITAESICYMPGYGISSAATTLVGQSIGARRRDLARSFSWLTVFTGITVMSLAGLLMYFACPRVFAFLTPDPAVQQLGIQVLRIELLAEPLFAASIVATGCLRGAGDTLIPGILNLVSIWGIRLTLGFILSQTMGLAGMWIAMAAELSVRGILFLIRLKREKWLRNA